MTMPQIAGPLAAALDVVAEGCADLADPWWVFGSAGMALVGVPGLTPPDVDLIVLPGSKSVQSDLNWLREMGWEAAISRHLRYGGKLIGICGGLQMLGKTLHDPLGIEGQPGSAPGLGLMDYETTLAGEKTQENVSGALTLRDSPPIAGYRIHMGVTQGKALDRPATPRAGAPLTILIHGLTGS